jgi:hypothetical protein
MLRGELPFPPYPPCLLEELLIKEIIVNWIGNKIPLFFAEL